MLLLLTSSLNPLCLFPNSNCTSSCPTGAKTFVPSPSPEKRNRKNRNPRLTSDNALLISHSLLLDPHRFPSGHAARVGIGGQTLVILRQLLGEHLEVILRISPGKEVETETGHALGKGLGDRHQVTISPLLLTGPASFAWASNE